MAIASAVFWIMIGIAYIISRVRVRKDVRTNRRNA